MIYIYFYTNTAVYDGFVNNSYDLRRDSSMEYDEWHYSEFAYTHFQLKNLYERCFERLSIGTYYIWYNVNK